jgi:hypothetical protein
MTRRRSLAPLLALLAARAAVAGEAPAAPPLETYAYIRGANGTARVPLLAEGSASTPIAMVDDQVVTLRDLNDALAATHEARANDAHAAGRGVAPVLERLVTLRLFVAEAREMGLDQQPGFLKAVGEFKEQQLRSQTEMRATKGVRPEAMEVERAYRDAVREWKVRSLLFAKKEDAVAFRAEIAGGKAFADAAKEAVAAKRATGGEAADWVARSHALPQVAAALTPIQTAPAVTDPVELKDGFAVASVEEVRYPEDPKARAMAEDASVERQRAARLAKRRGELEKKYAKTDARLWKSLDFEAAKPGFAALAKDRRPVVTLRGAKPVTVADVAAEMQRYFFHGVDEPIKEKKLNDAKEPVLHKILTRRLFLREGEALRVASSPEYRRAVSEYEDSLLFGAYVQTVILPDVKVSEDQGKAYYERHKDEFTYPAFFKLEGLAFSKSSAAEAAAKKLAAGTDFGFLRANAESQVKPDDRILALDGQTFSANTLPPDLVRVLGGARRDDVRAYSTSGQHYVIRVVEVTPAREQPYLEARAAIGKKLAAENLNKAVKDTAAKLRGSHQVAVYLERLGN